jgi:DegV family protein with EDD domain
MAAKVIRFVTDSTADVPQEILEKHNIGVVPVFVNYGGNSFADDGKELNRESYYNQLATFRPFPTTSAMPPNMTEQALQKALEGADHVIVLTVSSKLSGVYNAFRLGMQKLPADRITLIDGASTSAGLGMSVIVGAEVAAQTGDVQQTIRAIEAVKQNSKLFAALDTLEFLHRSGRVGWAAAGIGALLQIKPIIAVENGEVVSVARVRTFSRATEELVNYARQFAPLDRLAVLYGVDYEAAQHLRDRLADIAPAGSIFIVRINPAVGTHIGPKGLGVVPLSAKWKS